ncbi:unnamed protein product [Calypogeia fissa]
METLTYHVSEFSNHAMLMYQTKRIKAELRRRKTLTNHTQDSDSMLITDHLLPTAPPPPLPSIEKVHYNCNRSEMKRVFDVFDKNKDGLISAEELQLYMKKLGLDSSEQTVKGIVGSVDRNSDDLVDFEEFYSLYSSLSDEREKRFCLNNSSAASEDLDDDEEEEDTLLKAFFVFDENRDGMITAAELQHVLLKLGIAEGRSSYGCKKMIEKVDADGNGCVDFFEFKDMMCSTAYTCGSS